MLTTKKNIITCLLVNFVCALAFTNIASANDALPEDLTEIGLKELLSMDLEVTSASKKKQKLSEVASAVFVLREEDIRRSGVTNIADALRLVPGVNVARITSNQYAISIRGFNQGFANKLLVMIDGRSVFTPLFNGVYWEVTDLVLEDIERIEVIRGPGGSIWGANAVNGVINIITKHAEDTQRTIVSAGGGSEEEFITSVSKGGAISEDTQYRVYGKYRNVDNAKYSSGDDALDNWSFAYTGFRIDSQLSESDSLSVNTDIYQQKENVVIIVPSTEPPFQGTSSFSEERERFGASLNTRWVRAFSEKSDLQFRFDYTGEDRTARLLDFQRHTLNLEGQHRFSPMEHHDFIYGAGFKFYRDDVKGSFADDIDPEKRSITNSTWFFHDEIALLEEELHLIIGSKFEYNTFTDFEVMPNARLIWNPDERSSLWASVSRAVATPSRVANDVIVPVAAFPEPNSGLTGLVTLMGNDRVESEDLLAYEIGYRVQVEDNLSFDVATFVNIYDDVVSHEPEDAYVGMLRDQQSPALIIPIVFDNKLHGRTVGGEVTVDWRAVSWMRLVASFSHINIDISQATSNDNNKASQIEGLTPQNSATLRTAFDLSDSVELDVMGRYVDRLSFSNVDSYVEVDVRLGWEVIDDLELSIVGNNLVESSHLEFVESLFTAPATEIERGVYGKVSWKF